MRTPLKRHLAVNGMLVLVVGIAIAVIPGCGAGPGNSPGKAGSSTDASNPAESDNSPWFTNVTEAAKLDFQHDRGPERFWLPEMTGGGCAWIDYDRDGWLDLYCVQSGQNLGGQGSGGPGNQLFRNQGDGTFADVTAQTGVGDTQYGMGVTVGDYDQDGFDDLYVTNVGQNVLYRNQGDGTFRDVTERAGVGRRGWSTAAAFVDYDQDGDTDLYVVNYIDWAPEKEIDCRNGANQQDYCSPVVYQAPAPDTLYRNRGDGTFEDVSAAVGLQAAYGNGLGLVVCDFNQDGLLDFYVANDGNPNQLWLQTSAGTFQDVALKQGCSVNRYGAAEAGMGVAAIDVENDGDFDLFMTHLAKETNTLYLNQGKYFSDATSEFKLAAPSVDFTGFGLSFADFDQDGLLDLFVANGRVSKWSPPICADDVYAEPNLLFRGTNQGRFDEVRPQGGTDPVLVENSRAAAMADYDQDGDFDVALVNNGGQATLLRNDVPSSRRWIQFRLHDRSGRDPVGAQVGLLAGGTWQWRLMGRTAGFLSANDPRVHFGLGSQDTVDQVRVVWPGGKVEQFGGASAGVVVELREGEGTPTPDAPVQ